MNITFKENKKFKKLITKYDSKNMFGILMNFSDQCKHALSIGKKTVIPSGYRKKYTNVVFAGMGGSAIGASIIKDYLSLENKLPIEIIRAYNLPGYVNNKTLFFAVSYSGNTEETLSMYAKAKEKKASVICISSGGTLEALARSNNDLFVKIPGGLPPRCAVGYAFLTPLSVMSRIGVSNLPEIYTQEALSDLNKTLSHIKKSGYNEAIKIAYLLKEKFSVFYASSELTSCLALRWRGQVNENSKMLCSHNLLPEINHNEIEGWAGPKKILKNFIIIFFEDEEDDKRVKYRIKITSGIFKRNGFKYLKIKTKGKNKVARLLNTIYLGDFVSFYLALLNGTDPTPVERIDYFKKCLSRGSI